MRTITWEEAEAEIPTCSAAFDRDIGDLMRDATIYAVDQTREYAVPLTLWVNAKFPDPEDLSVAIGNWLSHVTTVHYLSGHSDAAGQGVGRYMTKCTCGSTAMHHSEFAAHADNLRHCRTEVDARRTRGLWAKYESSYGRWEIRRERIPLDAVRALVEQHLTGRPS